MSQKVILVIMDGWGIAENPKVSAVDAAHTPFYDASRKIRANSKLFASEQKVGLPEGQMGNSEVGHMNIGAGRIVFQDLVRIGLAIESEEIAEIPNFQDLISYSKSNQKPIHLFGLLSNGGVHSHIDHLKGILTVLSKIEGLPSVFIHAFMDGRDTDPKAGLAYMRDLEAHIAKVGCGQVASIIGRYFAMDRNQIWERIQKSYDLLLSGKGARFESAIAAIEASYAAGITDEFMEPALITKNGEAVALLKPEDAVLFFNFRTDRGRQLTRALTQEEFPDNGMHTIPLKYVTMTSYDDSYKGVSVLFEKDNIQMGLGETLAKYGKKQIRIAETEKYPHVTFFFNGGRETPFEGESRILCPSPSVATYDLKPQMSAFEIRDKIIAELDKGEVDFICLNFANPDMVGHTGIFEAAVKACETVDACTEAVVNAALKNGYTALVTADHGNADCMINPDGSANTAHSTALVPLLLFDPSERGYDLKDGKLGDLAPTILALMGLEIPKEMKGEVLIQK